MAMQSVTSQTLPPFKPTLEDVGFDQGGAAESARWALNGASAIATIMMENIEGATKGQWSEGFMWHLHQGQEALMAFARYQVDALQHELWYTHSLLGDYGEHAKERAQNALVEAKKNQAACNTASEAQV